MEKRSLTRPLELRASASGGRMAAGYAAIFNEETVIGDFFREKISPGAFAEAIKGNVAAVIGHDLHRIVGRTGSGTLRLREDSTGLHFENDIPDTVDGRDLVTLVERGDIAGMSFAFRAVKERWDDSGHLPLRTIDELVLREITYTWMPQYEGTSIAMRSLEDARKEVRAKNFNAAAKRLSMKVHLDLKGRE